MAILCQVDSIVVRNGRCFGWGWCLDPGQPVAALELEFHGAHGSRATVACIPGSRREDVGKDRPQIPHAMNSGFLILGDVPGLALPIEGARMSIRLRDGSRREVDLPLQALSAAGLAADGNGSSLRARVLAKLRRDGLRAALSRLGQGARAALARMGAWPARVLWSLRKPPSHVVFDHAMGGGANRFANALVDRLAADGRPVLRVSPVLHELRYRVAMTWRGATHAWIVEDVPGVLRLFSPAQQLDVHVNELVSFDDPLGLVEWCAARRDAGGSLTVYVHDFFAACPSWTLIDAGNRFCGIPDLSACEGCLPRNAANTMGYRGPGIPAWRAAWRRLLERADGIVAFSAASVDLLRRAYPSLRDEAVRIEPHAVAPLPARFRAPPAGNEIVVGVAGHISIPKGALVLKEMAALVRERALPLRIVVFGTLEQHDEGDGIEVLGEYAHAELPALMERHGVSLAFLPSICAETFSFVTAEYMGMGVPTAVFPLGAPAERVAGYDRGLVISAVDAVTAVHEIMGFAARGFARPPATREP